MFRFRNLGSGDEETGDISPLTRTRSSNGDSNFPLRKTGIVLCFSVIDGVFYCCFSPQLNGSYANPGHCLHGERSAKMALVTYRVVVSKISKYKTLVYCRYRKRSLIMLRMLYTGKQRQRKKEHKSYHIKTSWNSGCPGTGRCHFLRPSTVEAKYPGYELM